MTLWFISDTHFSHGNTIFKFKRPDGTPMRSFESVEHMDETMVERWNSRVKPSDHVYHLGDVSMKRPKHVDHILRRLNGHKRLVRGNHDIAKTKEYLEYFDEIYGTRYLDNIVFSHYPIHEGSLGRYAANVHGHIHTSPGPSDKRYINISVEVIDYTPVSLEELKQRIAA